MQAVRPISKKQATRKGIQLHWKVELGKFNSIYLYNNHAEENKMQSSKNEQGNNHNKEAEAALYQVDNQKFISFP